MVDVAVGETSTCKEKEKKSREKMRKQKGEMRHHQAAVAAGEDCGTCQQKKTRKKSFGKKLISPCRSVLPTGG